MVETSDGGWQTPAPSFNPFHLQSWITFLFLSPAFVTFADGCIRRSLFQPQSTTPHPTSTPSMDDTTGTTVRPSHKVDCLAGEVQSQNCLHGGTCFVVIINDRRQSNCHCTADWQGQRCEQVHIDPGILASMEENMRTANIAAGVSVCILVIFVILLAIYVYLRYRRKQRLLLNRDGFDVSTEESYREPFSKRSSNLESKVRPDSFSNPSASDGQEIPTTDGHQVYITIGATDRTPSPPGGDQKHHPVVAAQAPPLPHKTKESVL